MSIENGEGAMVVNDEEGPSEDAEESEPQDGEEKVTVPAKSHFMNKEANSCIWRYGIPIYLLATFGLLLASDLGSGVAAEYYLYYPDGTEFEHEVLFNASIFTSVKELWNTGSYALTILIVITSIMWPYLKLILSLVAWVLPYRKPRRREHLIEIVDALGKWSFVDIFVLLVIMVAFRATIPVGNGAYMEVVVVPRWGFFGFVLATMLSLLGTQAILYKHRRVEYGDVDAVCQTEDEEGAQEEPTTVKQPLAASTNVRNLAVLFLLSSTLALVIAGCVIYIFEVTNKQAGTSISVLYSVLSVGSQVPSASLDPNHVGIRWIQAMYYFLGFALPLWSVVLFGILYWLPMTPLWHRRVFMLAEMTFSWSSIEVLMVSVVFSVLQIPTFGNGLIESGCEYCYNVSSSIFPEFAVLAVGAALHVAVSIWLYRRAHSAIYPDSNEQAQSNRCIRDVVCCKALRQCFGRS